MSAGRRYGMLIRTNGSEYRSTRHGGSRRGITCRELVGEGREIVGKVGSN